MRFLNFIKNNKALTLIIIVIIVVLASIYTLIFLKNPSSQTNPNSSVGSDIKGYDKLKQSIDSLSNDSKVYSDSNYGKLITQFGLIGDKSLSVKDRYAAVVSGQLDIQFAYTDTHNPKFKEINTDLEYVAKVNFPKLYKPENFILYCQDEGCQDTAQPQEITKIIDEIKASDVANYAKQSAIDNLTNVGYMSSKTYFDKKIYSYIVMARLIKKDGEFQKSGVGDKFSNEIFDYLLTNYPDVVNKVLGEKNIEDSKAKLESQ